MFLRFTFLTFQPKHDLARRLGLLVKDGLGLSTEAHLLRVVPTLPLRKVRRLAGFVLRYLVHLVFATFATGAICLAFLGYVNHDVVLALWWCFVRKTRDVMGEC